MSDFIHRIDRLYKVSKLDRFEAMEAVKQMIREREASTMFDTTWLEHLDERSLLESSCVKVTPLMHNPGRLMITDRIVYFQALNNVESHPVSKYAFSNIVRVIKRRHSLLHIGLEIFFEDEHASLKSIFFTFDSTAIRNNVFNLLTEQPGMTKLQHESQSQVTFRWQCGLTSNFDYLMYLNSLADRTFNDLTQYPVFPWILEDFSSPYLDLTNPAVYRDLSKPIGALTRDRLSFFQKRYREMDTPRFMYGTHYSTPGYVLYYLVRTAPEYMLRLQSGSFDHADRMFGSIQGSWKSVKTNVGDLKELIPEFFVGDGKFLVNSDGLKLGRKQDGTWLGDVVLPPWASNAKDFIVKHREALESDYVSDHLHEWIDLIFGCKQKGEAALKANNLFHPLTYEGAVDLETITDPIEKEAILVQINEFGQAPKQLFTKSHPQRFSVKERERKLAAVDPSSSLSSGLYSSSPTATVASPIATTTRGGFNAEAFFQPDAW
eukprot:TRINITY_DN5541_c0_g1_i1.p1 TRINITY_DN5541_c0_g1~~TRINITY_DN5541_c0_g1_i1.p1  ORF type:complete len:533 (-),score=86.27 TRINITY_DN5541_c0_g1_i1:23-1495(-)